MAEIKVKSNEVRDYKERFEFRLTVGDNIICQRYFKINNFNPVCLRSLDLVNTIRNCARVIDRDLKQKTHIYLDIFSPQYFDTVEEMNAWLANPYNTRDMLPGNGLVVRNSDKDYFLGKDNTACECSFKFDDGELCNELTDDCYVDYKFAFYVDGEEVCSTVWTGVYPKYVRNSIDLSNKRGKFDKEEVPFLSFEQYLLYRMVDGRSDLVWGLIKDICYICSLQDSDSYTTELEYGNVTYKNKSRFFDRQNTSK